MVMLLLHELMMLVLEGVQVCQPQAVETACTINREYGIADKANSVQASWVSAWPTVCRAGPAFFGSMIIFRSGQT